MSTSKTISEALNLIDTKKQNLKKAFENLQPHCPFLHSLPLSWLELDSHFTSLQHSLTNRFHILQSLEQSHSKSQSKALTNYANPNNRTSKHANYPSHPSDAYGILSNQNKLNILCEKMDGVGLMNYVIDNLKDKVRVQEELIEAFRYAPDVGVLVLQMLERFHGLKLNGDCNDWRSRRMGRVCVMLLRVMSFGGVNVSYKAREKALKVAVDWKGSLMGDCGNILKALGFMYLVYVFGIVSEFSMDELVEISTVAAVNVEFMQLCRDVGLTDRVPEIVQKLVDKGKYVLAVKYVFEFNLVDKIPPVPILKACVDASKKLAIRLSQEGRPWIEVTDREMRVLKTVIETIENYKLESEYPRASLEQRIEQLKGKGANMKDRSPASILNRHTLQRRQRKRRMKKQQQNGIKLPRTFTSVGPEAVLMSVSDNNSTICQYEQPLVRPSGLLPNHPNPYTSSPATPLGIVAPTPTMPSYTSPSAGPSGNPNLGGSHLNSSEPNVPSAYYDGEVA
ncbi:truncated FRIGIDA-like protein 1 isoform X2 [Vicia villosa]|uniref:truncated FRIGIDA-like protein 1 isoform X2 n=1 Tax=Vicia villosa TaxID=3911 RepID=UPI00273C14CE|nr:truncated FRIGIDA-like protein 1 isoform X2 [Vicia villosa]